MKKTLIVLSVIFLMTGLAVGQEAEDFQTEEPEFVQQFHPEDILTDQSDWESVEANLPTQPYTIEDNKVEISADTNYGYATAWMYDSNEFESDGEIQRLTDGFVRGEIEVTHEVGDNVFYDLVVFEDSDLDEIRYRHGIGGFTETDGIETQTLSWTEDDLADDEDFDHTFTESTDSNEVNEHYVGIVVQSCCGPDGDTDLYEIDMNQPQTSYEETFFNGTLSTSWIVPEELQFQNQYADRFDGDADFQISQGGTEGDYHLDITTDGLTGLEHNFDDDIDQYTYFNTDFAVEEGGTVYYGLNDGSTDDIIDEGIKVDNENNIIRPIVNGEEESGTNLYDGDDLENWNSLHQVMNGYENVWSVSPEIGEQRPYSSLWSETDHDRYYYWRNSLGLPATMTTYDSVVILVESEIEESETDDTIQASFDSMTYDIVPTETDVGDPDDGVSIDTGEIEGIDDRDEIIDGGRIDSLIRWTANILGIGLQSTRFLLGLVISGLVGLGIGYREEIESDDIAVAGFGITFFSLTFIGLIPIRLAIIFVGLLVPLGWKIYKSQTKVKV